MGVFALKRRVLRIWACLGVLALLCGCAPAGAALPAAGSQPQTVIIDPGHGGEDGGATGVSGTQESGVNLAVSLRLEAVLRLFGVEPVLIRRTDTAVYAAGAKTIAEKKVSDLHNRTELVNRTPNALLVSIHQNYFPEGQYSGAQVFYAADAQSRALAQRMQTLLRETLNPGNRREAKAAPKSVYLMNHIQCVGVLVECGFLSNAGEEAKLITPAYQTQLALTIAAALLEEMEGTNEV